jgi:hypothetical protein
MRARGYKLQAGTTARVAMMTCYIYIYTTIIKSFLFFVFTPSHYLIEN